MNTETTETEIAEVEPRAKVPLTLTSRLQRRGSCTGPEEAPAASDAESAPPLSPLPPVKSDSEVFADPLSPSFPSRASVEISPAVHSASSIENQKSKIENVLYDLTSILMRFVVLPPYAAETLALWILHTYAFDLRDISTYIGIESPGKGCGKTTLLRVLGKLVRKPVSTANVSPSALFRVIEELQPTLLIDEGDTFLRNNDELRGILNAGYTPDTAFVLRASNETSVQSSVCSVQNSSSSGPDGGINPCSSVVQNSAPSSTIENPKSKIGNWKSGFRQFSTWCPKAIAMIGRLPDTLADRCIIIRMQKKPTEQKCERLRDLDAADLPARCAEFARYHADAIARARPQIPNGLSDRAADIWEPLLVLADLAGDGKDDVPVVPNPVSQPAEGRDDFHVVPNVGPPPLSPLPPVKEYLVAWPELARKAAVALAGAAQEQNPIAALLSDIQKIFTAANTDRLWSRAVASALNQMTDRPWRDLTTATRITEGWLSRHLRKYGILSRNICIGGVQAKGYYLQDCQEILARYVKPT